MSVAGSYNCIAQTPEQTLWSYDVTVNVVKQPRIYVSPQVWNVIIQPWKVYCWPHTRNSQNFESTLYRVPRFTVIITPAICINHVHYPIWESGQWNCGCQSSTRSQRARSTRTTEHTLWEHCFVDSTKLATNASIWQVYRASEGATVIFSCTVDNIDGARGVDWDVVYKVKQPAQEFRDIKYPLSGRVK